MSDVFASACCCDDAGGPGPDCADWIECAPQTMSLDWTRIHRQVKRIHGGITLTLQEYVWRYTANLSLDPANFRLVGTLEATLTWTAETEQAPAGGVVGFTNPPCLSCNGCPSCGPCCEGVYVCTRVVKTARASGLALVTCFSDVGFGGFGTQVDVQIDGSTIELVSESTSAGPCPWPCEPPIADGDLAFATFPPLPPMQGQVGSLPNWPGCVDSGDGLQRFNAALNSSYSESQVVDGDPIVGYMVIDPSLGFPDGNPENIVCIVAPSSQAPQDQVPWTFQPCDCSSTYTQEEIAFGSLS